MRIPASRPRSRLPRRVAAALLALGLGAGCATAPWSAPDAASEAARREYEAALARLPADPAGAVAALEAFLEARPRSPLADDAGLELGRLLAERGNPDAAVQRLAWVLRTYPSGDRTEAARLLLARLEFERGNVEAAHRLVGVVRHSRLRPDEVAVAYRLAADVERARDNRLAELRWLVALQRQLEGPEAVEMDAEIDGLLQALSEEELLRAAEQLGSRPPAARVSLRLAELALGRRDDRSARAALAHASDLELSPELAERLARLEALLAGEPGDAVRLPSFAELAALAPPSTQGASGTLGVILPLSGSLAGFGEESLRGILLAAGIFEAPSTNGSPPNLRLLVRDSQGSPEGASAAVRSLDHSEVVALLGPLLGPEAEAAAEVADAAGIPLLALTAREEVARGRPEVFRLGLSPRSSVEILVDYAVHTLELGRFAVLYPKNEFGRGYRDLFWNAVERSGGRITAVAGYDPEATDFAGPIRSMVGFTLLRPEEREALEEREKLLRIAERSPPEKAAELREEAAALTGPDEEPLPPIVDFDALFIADDHEKAALIAPQLAFHEISGVRLLGPGGWNHPDLLRIAGRHVDGAVFADAFDAASDFPPTRAFTEAYRAAYGEDPGVLAAQAFDAATLALVQLARSGASRDALRRGVLGVSAFPGVSGVTSIGPDGNARKRPYLLTVEGRRIVSLD